MWFFSKFIIAIFVSLLGLFVLFFTFFQWSSAKVTSILSSNTLSFSWVAVWSFDGEMYKESHDTSTTGDFFIERFSHLDSLYVESLLSYERKSTDELLLKNGRFVLDFRDVSKEHTFSWSWFFWNILGEGRVFIDTMEQDTVSIFSQSATVKISLLDLEWKTMTEMFLYPHMSFTFTPTRNQFVEKWDIVRMTSVHTLSYLHQSLFRKEWYETLTTYFQDTLFFSGVWKHIKYLEKLSSKQVKEISDIFVFHFPGEAYIEKYYSLFINQEKQKIYYKNKYLDSLIQILQGKNIDQNRQKLGDISRILSSFPEEKSDLEEIFQNLQFYYSYSYNDTPIDRKRFLFEMKNTSWDTQQYMSSLTLSGLYNTYDISWNYSYWFLEKFFSLYLSELWIDLKNQTTVTQKDRLYIDYFLFFLERIFLGWIQGNALWNDLQEENIFNIFSQYTQLSSIIYDLWDTKRKVTGLYIYVDILSGFEKYLFSSFFESQRGKNNVLIRKKGMSIDINQLTQVRWSIEILFDYYQKNKKFLDSENKRDAFIWKNLDSLQSIFDEYFSALENYDSYIFNYDETKKNLLSLQTGQSESLVFNEESIREYLSQFQWVSLSEATIRIPEWSSFAEIENLFINGSQLSFHITPLSAHLIDSLVIDGKNVYSAYKLDNIELDWEEKKKNASDKDRIRYDFSYFFINTFFSNNQEVSEIFEIADTSSQEDPVTVVFKRDKLLGEKWEFASLKNILPLEYKSIDVTENAGVYTIALKNTPLTLLYQDQNYSTQYIFDFSSFYRIDQNTHEFYDISLLAYKDFVQDSTLFNFDRTPIKIQGNISLKEFEWRMKDFIFSYNIFSRFYFSFESKISLENKKFEYILGQDVYTIEGKLWKKQVKMHISQSSITSLQVDGKEKIKTPLSLDSISKIQLLLLTK